MRKRNHAILIRLSEKEYEKLKQDSEKANLNVTQYIRNLIMQVKMRERPKEEWQAIVRNLGGACNNINQVTRKINIYQKAQQEDLKEINCNLETVIEFLTEKL